MAFPEEERDEIMLDPEALNLVASHIVGFSELSLLLFVTIIDQVSLILYRFSVRR